MNSTKPDRSDRRTGMSRRQFLTGVGAGTIGATVSSQLLAAAPGEGKDAVDRILDAQATARIVLTINGHDHPVLVEPRWTLLYVLREVIGLTGSKEGCGRGECGACTVLIDDLPRYACMILAVEAEGKTITTVEGLLDGEALGPVQTAFAEADAFQCGYCTPGQIMSVEGLLRKTPDPSTEEIRTAVSGNLCRCGAYSHIVEAAADAAKRRK